MHECEICGFKTGRLDAFKRHMNRKNPCKVIENGIQISENGIQISENGIQNAENGIQIAENGIQNAENGIQISENGIQKIENNTCTRCGKCFSTKYNLRAHVSKCTGSTNNPLQCEICLQIFATRQNKYRHKKNVNCKPPPVVCQPVVVETQPPQSPEAIDDSTTCPYCEVTFSRIDSLKRHMTRCQLKHSGGNITTNNNNTNNTTNNNTNCHNTINNITINYNSYDKPCIEHVTKEHVKDLYLGNNRDLKKLIHAGVCEIWKKKENNSFKLPFRENTKVKVPKKCFRDNEPIEVFSDGEERLFPADHVVEVVLQKAAEVCESILRQHHNEETIQGRGVLKHANVLEELACNFREVWDDDKVFRSGYKPFVRTALLECMRDKEKNHEEDEDCEDDREEEDDTGSVD